MNRRTITILGLLAGLILTGVSSAAVECPEMGVTLTGTGQHIMGGTYSEHVELEKISGGPGYNGKWRVRLFKSTTTYQQHVGAISIPTKRTDFGLGLWMNCDAAVGGNTAVAVCKDGNLELDVVNNRVGYIKTDVWIGKITGDTMTIKFHKENPIEPNITGTIYKVSGGELELRITQPTHEQKVVYSPGSPGELQIDLKAEVTPASLKNSIQWTLPDIEGAVRTTTPANAMGPDVTVTYKGLPQKNSEFGFKEITASIDAGLCKATESADVAVYFPRDAKNNPGGSEPNWFYYWSQTAARKGPVKYGSLAGKCASGADSGGRDGLVGYYRYTIRDTVYYICDLGRLPGNFEFDGIRIVTQNPLQIDNQRTTGIDTFAVASHHENAHYEHFKQWWFQFNPNPISPTGEHMMSSYDTDGDFIPNAEEPAYSLDPNNKFTLQQYNSQIIVDDEEWLSMLAETTWQPGNADHVDWAKPGKQWP